MIVTTLAGERWTRQRRARGCSQGGLCPSINVFARSTRDEAIHSFFVWRDGLLRLRSQ